MMKSGNFNYHQISLESADKKGQSLHLVELIGILKKTVSIVVYAAVTICLIQAQSLTLEQDGPAFLNP